MQIKKFPKVAVVATKLNFLQYTYRFGINHKTLYSQTFPGPHFGSWTINPSCDKKSCSTEHWNSLGMPDRETPSSYYKCKHSPAVSYGNTDFSSRQLIQWFVTRGTFD